MKNEVIVVKVTKKINKYPIFNLVPRKSMNVVVFGSRLGTNIQALLQVKKGVFHY